MFVCHATMRPLGAWCWGWGGKWWRFLGRLFRTSTYKYPWKAIFREPANQLTNQSHTLPDIPQPSFPPTFPLFSPSSNSNLLWFHINLLSAPFYKQMGNITSFSCWLSITYALWSACFLKKKNTHILIKLFNLIAVIKSSFYLNKIISM